LLVDPAQSHEIATSPLVYAAVGVVMGSVVVVVVPVNGNIVGLSAATAFAGDRMQRGAAPYAVLNVTVTSVAPPVGVVPSVTVTFPLASVLCVSTTQEGEPVPAPAPTAHVGLAACANSS
jgi:hypothetical protein